MKRLSNSLTTAPILLLLVSTKGFAQEFKFQREVDTIPVFVNEGALQSPFDRQAKEAKPALVDIDNDGDLDLFVGESGGNIHFFRNTGSPSNPVFIFEELIVANFTVIDVGNNSAPTFADIDNDRDFDLFVGESDGNINFYRNTGTASNPAFTLESDKFASIVVGSESMPTFADIDDDGDLDLFVGEKFGTIYFYRNIGTVRIPVFTFVTEDLDPVHVGFDSAPTFADIDKDGDWDLFVGNSNGNLNYYRNEGSASNYMLTLVTQSFANINVGSNSTPNLVDIDNDGDLDLLVGGLDGGIRFYQNSIIGANPIFQLVAKNIVIRSINVGVSSAPTFVDLDADGDFDFFVGEGNGNINFFRNIGTASSPAFTIETENFALINAGIESIPTFVDIDNDRDWDLFVGESSGQIRFYRNNGSAANPLMILESNKFASIDVGNYCAPAFADIDDDGDLDLFPGESGGWVRFHRNIGTALNYSFFYESEKFASIDVGNYSTPTFADIDSDGDFDLFIGESGGMIRFHRNIGTAMNYNFIKESDFFASIDVGDYSKPTFVDIDKDGDLDLFVGDNEGNLYFYRNLATQKRTLFRSPITFIFNATEGGTNPPKQILQIRNSGGDTLNWSVDDDQPWLNLLPTSGSSIGDMDSVGVGVNIAGLSTGTYSAMITISAIGALNTPQTTSVKLNITSKSIKPPTADFRGTPQNGQKPLRVTFTDASIPGETAITSWAWDFNDDGTADSQEKNPTFTYNTVGTYTVSLTVIDTIGLADRETKVEYINAKARQNQYPGVINSVRDTSLIFGAADFTRDLHAFPVVFNDPDGDTLVFSASSSNESGATATILGSLLKVTPLAIGTARITIRASDSKGGIVSTAFSVSVKPPAYPIEFTVNASISFPRHSNASDYKAADYRILGLPGKSNLLVKEFLSGEQNKDWQVFWDNGAERSFFVEFDGTSKFWFSTGRAFWIIKKGALSINTTVSSAPLNFAEEIELPLHSGWNLITNPFTVPISWPLIRSANNVTDPIWAFDGSFSQASDFEPYIGYYFFNATNLSSLKIPYSLYFLKTIAHNVISISWQVSIVLLSGTFKEKGTSLGIAGEARPDLDRFDFRKPRAIAATPTVEFKRPTWDAKYSIFATDIRPEFEESESWEFDVRTISRQPAQLTFSGISKIPGRFEVYLIDADHAQSVNLREDSLYHFTPAAELMKFKVVVGRKENVQEQLRALALPKEFALGPNYPNPFSQTPRFAGNPTTTIPIEVPVASEIKLKLYNLLGAEVKTIYEDTIEAGRYWFNWDGRNELGNQVATGVYLYRLTTSNGVSLLGKMILLR